jgi:ubiquinone/menaquinone biosynthesis C-methylase UbiE
MDSRQRFRGAADVYARYRPAYPGELVDWVLAEAGASRGARAADIGCGTGILTRMLADRGLRVVGIDPAKDMLDRAREGGGGAGYVTGEAAATGLRGGSVTLVTVAQAFHWFDHDAALGEFHRILRPAGHVAAIWNLRGAGPFMDAYDALLRRFSREYSVVESWEAALERLRLHHRVQAARERRASHAQSFDFEGLHGRAWSSSYVRHGVADPAGFDAALRDLFDTHTEQGAVEFAYQTVACIFRVAP